ncbi:MAG TPA: hypothetical protein VD993_17610 [Chitinophagaceae bacterium]|nr:hypothetical protein [Chitinophagaceae bacterium]
MSAVLMVIVLTILQFIAGFGVLSLFKISLKPAMQISLSLLMGVAVFSLVPLILQLNYMPITRAGVFISLVMACLLLNMQYKTVLAQLKTIAKKPRFRIQLYEVPALIVISLIVLISVWRCFYLPPTSRDLTSGPEVIAEYAVREKTMVNSVFLVNLETTNNQFKSTFITSLQVIYKYAGFPFGQLWLSTIFVCFLVFLYHALSLLIHRMLAGLLLICFLAIPEMYAYTFMALYDYSNAVFFFLAAWFLNEFMKTGNTRQIAFAGLLMGIATYIRSETLVLAAMLALVLIWIDRRKPGGFRRRLIPAFYFLLPSAIFYYLQVNVYIDLYLPVSYEIKGLVNPNLLDLQPLFQRFADINTELIFSKLGIIHYGYFIFIFLFVLLIDIIWKGWPGKTPLNWLYAVLVVYLGLALLGYLLPLLDLPNSTKRGLFKMFPLMLLYMGNSTLLIHISRNIEKWETGLRAVRADARR